MPKITIAYINESLGSGGAERQLVELVRHLDKRQFDIRVMTYVPDNFYLPELKRLGIPVHILSRKGKWDLRPVIELADWLRSGQVDLVHAYLNTANLYAVLAKKLARRGKVVVSERSTSQNYVGLSRLNRILAYKCADMTITNNITAQRDLLRSLRLNERKVLFIPNGVNVDKFKPERQRFSARKKLGWSTMHRIALTIAGFKPAKNHLGMLNALAGFRAVGVPIRFYWVGQLASQELFVQIKERIAALNLANVVEMSAPRNDIVDLYRASDVVVLFSLWEGTPNVVLEAMACGRPVIATDVSDVSRYVIPGQTGWLIPPGDPDALRNALNKVSQMSEQDLQAMGMRGRRHLLSLGLDVNSMARRYEKVYLKLMEQHGRR